MKEKILELIEKELAAITINDLFYKKDSKRFASLDESMYYYTPTNPLGPAYIYRDWDKGIAELGNIMNFTLKFEDGEPDITVNEFAVVESQTLVPVKRKSCWSWLPSSKKETLTKYKLTSKIHCGTFEFELSPDERDGLFRKVVKANVTQERLKGELEAAEINAKLDLRLAKLKDKSE